MRLATSASCGCDFLVTLLETADATVFRVQSKLSYGLVISAVSVYVSRSCFV